MSHRIDNLSSNTSVAGDFAIDGNVAADLVITDALRTSAGIDLILPIVQGNVGEALIADGIGGTSWAVVSGGGGGGATDRIENAATTTNVVASVANAILFATAGAERLQITSAGTTTVRSGNAIQFNQVDNATGVSVKAAATGVTSHQYTLPVTQGAADTVLVNAGSGVLEWLPVTASRIKLTDTAISVDTTLTSQSALVSVSATGAPRIVTLPAANAGQIIIIVKTDNSANSVTVSPALGELLNGVINGVTVLSDAGDRIKLISTAQGWLSI